MSKALEHWQGERARILKRLVDAQRAVSGGGPGRKWLTEEVNHALIVRLAGEFQGYCRDLHDESATYFARKAVPRPSGIRTTVARNLKRGRKLNVGNANWANICNDFTNFGMKIAPLAKADQGAWFEGRVAKLESLNEARNAIAHQDAEKLELIKAKDPLTLRSYFLWKAATEQMAKSLDRVVADELERQFGNRPW